MDKNINSKFPDKKFNTFKDYFQTQYKVHFKHEDQFLLINKKKTKMNNGGVITEIITDNYFPPELLLPTGLTDEMRSDWRTMKDLGQITITFPEKKFQTIEASIERLENYKDKGGLEFQIDANSNKVVGYQIMSPSIILQGGKTAPMHGSRINLKGFLQKKDIQNWLFLYDFKLQKDCVDVIRNLKKASQRFDIFVHDPLESQLIPKNFSPQDLNQMIKKHEKSLGMVFFFIPPYVAKLSYKKMKSFLSKKGIVSQFLTSYNFKKDKNNLSKFGNIAIQMSIKMGGRPWSIQTKEKDLVVMGADVFHERSSKSVSSLVSLFG